MSTQFTFDAIGTGWYVEVYESITKKDEATLFDLIKNRIEIFDKAYSRFRDDSLVTEISHTAGTYTMPDDFKTMIELYRQMYLETGGLMTPLIGQLISDLGYDKDYSLVEKTTLQSPPVWEDILSYTYPDLRITQPVLLDFGAMGKGYLVDIVAMLIEACGYHSYTIDAGGDIIHRGTQSIHIGLENPNNTKEVIGVVDLSNQSICGSSGNRRKWGKFHHIINPETITSPREIISIWVIASSTILADALTTALFFTKPEKLQRVFEFEYLILNADFSIEKSSGFSAKLFTK